MSAITISREYGSGGGEIASRIADRLGWTLVDHQIVADVARRIGMTQEEASARDERGAGLVARVLDALLIAAPEGTIPAEDLPVSSSDLYHQAVCRVIEKSYNARYVVIVGRGAQALLQRCEDVLHIRVIAPLEMRISYVSQREGLSESAARDRIHSKQQGRDRYLQSHYHRRPNDPTLYDLTVNTRGISLNDAVDIVLDALQRKARQVGMPPSQRGPGVDVERYHDQPGDLNPSP
ncbi:MAG: cytidylate kinase-like family protein [Nitrolancea sp.]